ncbi:TIR domain-containing protein [Micromonospora tarensis]|uniref:TIR domain-containing protein n=1 Tax=Micromonospora tarensis TaxID=2806100 RepID=A0ABS1YIH3_9ACTN|nr:TIR domain-containing protein [Micromonospora tarensis]MBM0277178.1 TIR domain-containing protein [Micromonospora tarensis]
MTDDRALLLAHHENLWDGSYWSVGAELVGSRIRLSGSLWSATADVSEGTNEYNWADVQLDAVEFAEALTRVQDGSSWQLREATIHGRRIAVGQDDLHSPDKASVSLTERRFDLLLLDSYDAAFAHTDQARTGIREPRSDLDRAFLRSLRRHPDHLDRLRTTGLERTVLSLLNESNAQGVRLVEVAGGRFWLVHRADQADAAMLLSIEDGPSGIVGIDVVDRVNGARDRTMVSKAAIVTRSSFSDDVRAGYGARSQHIELVDYDRLSGMLRDAGWTSRAPGYLVCPVQRRPDHIVFISYSWDQADFAVWLYNQLTGWGFRCWLDRVDLLPGDVILSAVRQALDGVDAVVLCCSDEALASPWVRAEIAHCLAREQDTGRTMLIPVLLDDTDLDASPVRRDRLAADFRRWTPADPPDARLERLRMAIEQTIGAGRPTPA